MPQKAHFFLKNTYDTNGNINTETYGFNWKHHTGILKKLETLEKELFDIACSLKFRNTADAFQKQLKEDISCKNLSPYVFISSGKTNNIYKTTPEKYQKLLKDNVTKTYKKSSELLEKLIISEAKHIAKKLENEKSCFHQAQRSKGKL